ncbi:MAG: glycosyltransferase N-terminal domain-containing protein [Pseudomonadota bacterium]
MSYRNWLENKFQNGSFDRLYRAERLVTEEIFRPKGRLIWVHVDTEDAAIGMSAFLFRITEAGFGEVLLTSEDDLLTHVREKRLPDTVIYRHAPIGTRLVVERFLSKWRPDMAIWAAPKLHFRMIHEVSKRHIPLVWLDLKLSLLDRRRWRLTPRFTRAMFKKFDLILCQDRLTQKLLRLLRIGRDKAKAIGAFHSGGGVPEDYPIERKDWQKVLKDRQIWLAAHIPPGELNTVYDAFAKAKRQAHRLLLVLHTTSARPDGLRGGQFFIADRPDASDYQREMDVVVIKERELGMWYRLAPVTYLGGNLSDAESRNPFAAASLGSALLTGPRWSRYRDLYARLDEREGLEVVAGAQSLARSVVSTLAPDRAALLAHAAWDVCTEGAQVADEAVTSIGAILGERVDQDEAA